MLILLAVASLVWIGVLSISFISFSGAGISGGWIFASVLFLGTAAGVVFLSREFEQAIDDPEPAQDAIYEEIEILCASESTSERSRKTLAARRENILPREVAIGNRRSSLSSKTKTRRAIRPNRSAAR